MSGPGGDSLFPWEGKQPSPGPQPSSYEARMRRPDWMEYYRPRILKRAGGFCEACGKKTRCLEVHHLTYKRLGRERDEDLQAVCRPCHPRADEIRKQRNRRRASDGFAAWCYSFYDGKEPPDDAEERFYSWREEQ